MLPAEGRQGPLPEWPLEEPMTPAEERMWQRVWRSPQAAMWEANGWFDTVARYVRIFIQATVPNAPVALQGPTTTLTKELGLTPQGMRMLMWTVAPAKSIQDSPQATERGMSSVTDIRSRIKPVA